MAMVPPPCRMRTSPPDKGVPDTLSATVPLMSPSAVGAIRGEAATERVKPPAAAGEWRAEEVAERAVRRVNPGAGARRVGFDVRGRLGAGAVEACIGPGGGPRQRELE